MKWELYGRAERSAYKNQWVLLASGEGDKSYARAYQWWTYVPVYDEYKTEWS